MVGGATFPPARLCAVFAWAAVAAAAPPRVMLVALLDDVGWSNVGFTPGSSTATAGPNGTSLTPRLDALAADGVVLTNAMAHFMCTPSRCALLSGRLPVHVQQGQDTPETGTAGLPRNMSTLPAKLAAAGWRGVAAGKWDAGIATHDHMPEGRGFASAVTFAEHMVDSFAQTIYPGGTTCTLVDPTITDLWVDGAPGARLNGTAFVEDLFVARILDEIAAHDPGGPPLFLYWAPKAIHYPLQVPEEWYNAYAWVGPDDEGACNATSAYVWPGRAAPFACRRQAWALLGMLDANVGRIVDALVRAGLWNDTLALVLSDNGAPLDVAEAGGNNWPLRGSKYSPFQGGVRVPALAAGGYLPRAVRGTQQPGLFHIADVYSTLLGVAGVDPADAGAAAAGLPPVDGLDMWPLLSGANATSPRTEVPIAPGALVVWPHKLIRGWTWWSGRTGPVYPNASSPGASPDVWVDCGDGCVFDLVADEFEAVDLAPARPDLVAALGARLTTLTAGFWTNNDTAVDACPPNVTLLCGCWAAVHTWGGFLGPYKR